MTFRLATIVEGDGEVEALPVLVRRIAAWQSPTRGIEVLKPIRVRRDRFLNRPEEFSRHMQLARAKAGRTGGVLVLVDADDDCPVELARRIGSQAIVSGWTPLQVVVANREFEAWFAASADTLAGCRGFATGVAPPAQPERIRDAKGWIRGHTANRDYGPVADQAAFAARIDLERVLARSRSFRKLVKALGELTDPASTSSPP